VTRLLTRIVVLSFAALLGGCGSGAVRAPETPPAPVDPETRVQPRQKDAPRLIAPPPAYGNKVVMASAGHAGAVN
jgi:hypothetical protein